MRGIYCKLELAQYTITEEHSYIIILIYIECVLKVISCVQVFFEKSHIPGTCYSSTSQVSVHEHVKYQLVA